MNELLSFFPEDVAEEVMDERYLTSTHGKASTYNTGCRGPLCRMAQRERCAPDPSRNTSARARDFELKAYLEFYLARKGETSAA